MAAFRVFLIALALTAPVWVLHATSVSACSCGSTGASIADAEIVAVGTVTDIRQVGGLPDSSTVPEFFHINLVSEIAVEEYLWGSGGPSLLVYSDTIVQVGPRDELIVLPGSQPDCSYGLRLDARYLVVFTDADEELWASACSGSVREIRPDDALSDIRQLLQEPAPQPTVVGFPDTGAGTGDPGDSSFAWQLTAAAGVALAISASAIFAALRRRPS